MDKSGMGRKQKVTVCLLIITFVSGILSRTFPTGFQIYDKYLGDALYTVVFYLILSLIWKKGTPSKKSAVTAISMIAIETFQLTGISLNLSKSPNIFFRLISVVLGTTFSFYDISAYFAGLMLIYCLDRFYIDCLNT